MMSHTRTRSPKSRRLVLELLEDRSVPTCSLAVPGVFLDGSTLCVVGAEADEVVSVVRAGDEIHVYSNLVPAIQAYLAADVQGIEIYLADGDDTASLRPEIDAPALIYGGAGSDWLSGGAGSDHLDGGPGDDVLAGGGGHDILIGGDDNDWIFGNDGRDVLLGGRGQDFVVGQGGDDLLIGGATAYDDNPEALTAIRAEWTSERDYETRVQNIFDGTGSIDGANGGYFLEENVFDDGVADTMLGQAGQDWFVGSPGDYVIDLDGSEQYQVQ